MLNRYPEQTDARRAFAALGLAFLLFGLFMVWIEELFGAGIGVLVGSVFFIPAVFFSELAFSKVEKWLSWIPSGW